MNTSNSIFIVEDRTLLRQGLAAMLSEDPDLRVVGEAGNLPEAMRLAVGLSPRLVLMDLSLQGTDATAAVSELKRQLPGSLVLVLSIHKTEEHIRAALQAGADGYVLSQATREELMLAVKSLLNGKTYLSPDVAEKIVNRYLDGGINMYATTAWERLTLREREVLKFIAAGHANKHIANQLSVSVKTVEKHRANLMRKLDLHNAAALTAFAIERGILAE